MARYTIELRDIENCICYLFPKGFPFYTDNEELRLNFIQKFYDEYMFREIGFETAERFKRSLLGKLNKIMPYYTQLYHTELESKSINFMLNKDLIETFEREVSGSSEVNSNSTTNTTGTSEVNSNDMMYDTPNSRIDDITKYPTQGSQGESSASSTETVREYVEKGDNNARVLEIRSELEEKFPFALGAVCSNLATLDMAYRKVHGYDEQGEFSHYFIDLLDEFPLCERFVHACIMFVSSMVIIDIDDKKSDDFYDKYASAVSTIQGEIPFESVLTVEKYSY